MRELEHRAKKPPNYRSRKAQLEVEPRKDVGRRAEPFDRFENDISHETIRNDDVHLALLQRLVFEPKSDVDLRRPYWPLRPVGALRVTQHLKRHKDNRLNWTATIGAER